MGDEMQQSGPGPINWDDAMEEMKHQQSQPHSDPYLEMVVAERDTLRTQVAELKAALEPFALASRRYVGDGWSSGATIDEIELLKVSDLHAADAALASGPGVACRALGV